MACAKAGGKRARCVSASPNSSMLLEMGVALGRAGKETRRMEADVKGTGIVH